MAQGSCSQKIVFSSTVNVSKPKQPASPKGTSAPSDLRLPNAPAPDLLVHAPCPALASTHELFEQFMKAYLKAQTPAPISIKPRKQLFKACFPNFYYENPQMDCYRFYQ